MVRHKLDSVNECARKGYNLRITCAACHHAVEANAALMMQELGRRGAGMSLEAVERRARCTNCGHRGATVMPCAINF